MNRYATLLFAALLATPALAADFPRGQLIEKVTCAENPQESYALYLPSGYTPERAWPILYILDPRSRGQVAAERFRAGAEKYGYILASSYSTMSDGPMEPNLKAMRALWVDTHSRFQLDPRRAYAAGFSGTVRSACVLARAAPGPLAGLVGAGAGFPFQQPPKKGDPFVFFGTLGDKDFNYYEMMDLEPQLVESGLPHRIEIFDGAHAWPPEDLASRALGWMELQAMKSGIRGKDPKIVEDLWGQVTGLARAAEASGDLFQAHRHWSGAAADFAGLRDVSDAAAKAAELAANPALQRDRAARQERLRRDKEYLEKAPGILSAATTPSGTPVTVAQIVAALKIHEWRKRAESADRDEKLSAQRVLNTVGVQTGYYLPNMFTERKQHDRAVFVLSIAAEITPDSPLVFYNRAAAHARNGDRKKALADLRKAVENGWKDGAAIEKEEAFAGLRGEA
ncbi:MAG TPA: hypothetical protein VLE27_10280, partial [Thermoanaerobaculia bacterium]|nr:hypothetical protein [Thermoanaerobaculia bacterium]